MPYVLQTRLAQECLHAREADLQMTYKLQNHSSGEEARGEGGQGQGEIQWVEDGGGGRDMKTISLGRNSVK